MSTPEPTPRRPDLTVITGLSGAGRSEAANCLEDLGYFVVDNLPPALLGQIVDLVEASGGPERVAIVADARGGAFFSDLERALGELRKGAIPVRILYLEADDESLVSRFEASRRPHPLAPTDRVVDGIRKERAMMEALRGEADLVVDTSEISPQRLRDRIREVFTGAERDEGFHVNLVSFGYKYGIPRDADLVFDVRFLPNPHWNPHLRPLPGTQKKVRDYVVGQEAYGGFTKRLRALLDVIVPGYEAEGKHYLTVAVGCTGGRHRSVVVADELETYFRKRGLPARVEHRDLARE